MLTAMKEEKWSKGTIVYRWGIKLGRAKLGGVGGLPASPLKNGSGQKGGKGGLACNVSHHSRSLPCMYHTHTPPLPLSRHLVAQLRRLQVIPRPLQLLLAAAQRPPGGLRQGGGGAAACARGPGAAAAQQVSSGVRAASAPSHVCLLLPAHHAPLGQAPLSAC